MTANEYIWQQLDSEHHTLSLDHDYAPTGLLELISPAPRQVLDIGCFCGGSGKWLKERFPDVHLTGIETQSSAAEKARFIYDDVRTGMFEEIDTAPWQGQFDAIIAADVLEHMYNPWKVLQQLLPLLKPTGALYISLPNIRNLNIMAGLASGRWEYQKLGILDVTHIRFFTRAQAVEMLEQTGWQIDEFRVNVDPILMDHLGRDNLDNIKTLKAGNMTLENLARDDLLELATIQFIIIARPA